MSEPTDDKSGQRLEHLLRQWGVEEASRSAEPPEPPDLRSRRSRPRAVLLRWAPATAAAVLLVAAVGLLLTSSHQADMGLSARSEGPAAAKAQPAERVARLRDELQAARTKLARLHEQQEQHNKQLEAARREYQGRLDELEGTAERLRRQREGLQEREAALELAVADSEEDLRRVREELAGLKQRNRELAAEAEKSEAANKALARARERLEGLRKQYVAETQRLEKSRSQTAEALREGQAELARLKARRRMLLANMQRAYLGVGPDDRVTLEARQRAAKENRLGERCAEVGDLAATEHARKLMDTLQAVLIRLELLDPRSPSEAASFAELLDECDVVAGIDQAMESGREVPAVRSFLLEARVVLMGSVHVG